MNATNSGLSLVSILMRVSLELEAAGVSVDELHSLVDGAVREGVTNDRFFQEAQRIDILQQHLVELACFIKNIAAETPESWTVSGQDAVSGVKLSNLRDRLSHCHGSGASDHDMSGDMHLF